MIARLTLVAALVTSALHPTFAQKADPRREPGTAVLEAIRLLERKDYTAFLKTVMRPEELKEELEATSMEDLATSFAQRHAANVLSALKAASTMKPALNPAGTRAEYRFDQPIGGTDRVLFVKIGEHWFMRD